MSRKAIRVMIVDDEIFFRKVLREILERIGVSIVAEAVDGDDAVAKYRSCRPHLTMMDIYMPEKSGIDATREILELDGKARILMCSASSYDYDIEAAMSAGAKGVVMKPFVPKEVFEAMKKVLEGR